MVRSLIVLGDAEGFIQAIQYRWSLCTSNTTRLQELSCPNNVALDAAAGNVLCSLSSHPGLIRLNSLPALNLLEP